MREPNSAFLSFACILEPLNLTFRRTVHKHLHALPCVAACACWVCDLRELTLGVCGCDRHMPSAGWLECMRDWSWGRWPQQGTGAGTGPEGKGGIGMTSVGKACLGRGTAWTKAGRLDPWLFMVWGKWPACVMGARVCGGVRGNKAG